MTNTKNPPAITRLPITITKAEFKKILNITSWAVYRNDYFNGPNLAAMELPPWEQTKYRKKFNSMETKRIFSFFEITVEHFQE